jgi:TonB family protein
VRSTETESPLVFELRDLITGRRGPQIPATDTLERGRAEKIGDIAADCVNRKPYERATPWSYCFDPHTGDLLKAVAGKNSSDVPWKVQVAEFSNFQEWNHKRIARTYQGFNGKNKVLELQLEEIQSLPQLPSDYFAVPKEATSWMDCRKSAWKLQSRVSPVYPMSARTQHHQGTVVLYTVVDENGRPSELRIAHSARPDLDQSALQAVSQWRYERTSACPSSHGRIETLVDVVFSLR